jgi:3-oxoadipate enol-lactonase
MPRFQLIDDGANMQWNGRDHGRGPTLLLVHGFPLDHTMWAGQINELADTHRVLAPDLRGFGASTVTAGTVTMEQMADDLACLLDALDIRDPVTFCGLSMGGYIAWQFVRRHRAKVARLILCDTRAQADTDQAAAARRETAERVLVDGPGFLADAMIDKLFAPSTHVDHPERIQATRNTIGNTDPHGIAAAARGMAQRPDVTGMLPDIDVPALVLCGQHDAISTVAEMRQIAAAIPTARFVEIPAAGHMAPLENPHKVNQAIRSFLDADEG